MAARLRLTSRRIHWSLAAKAVLLGGAWYALPFWLYALLACALYFLPLFEPKRMNVPFVAALALGILFPKSAVGALGFGAVWFLVFGIRDLLFVDRALAYELLSFLILIFASLILFRSVPRVGVSLAFLESFLVAALFFLLVRGFVRETSRAGGEKEAIPFALLVSFLLWEWSLAVLLLPLHIFAQAAILFLMGAALFEIARHVLRGALTMARIAGAGSLVLGGTLAIFLVSPWGL